MIERSLIFVNLRRDINRNRDMHRRKAPRVPAQEVLGEIELKDNRCCRLRKQHCNLRYLSPSVSSSSEPPIKEPFSVARIENSVRTISRDQLKQKIARRTTFCLSRHSPLPLIITNICRSAIHLPLERMMKLATTVLPDKGAARF